MICRKLCYPRCHTIELPKDLQPFEPFINSYLGTICDTFPFPSRATRVLQGGYPLAEWRRDVAHLHDFIFQIFWKTLLDSIDLRYEVRQVKDASKAAPYVLVGEYTVTANNVYNIVIDYLICDPIHSPNVDITRAVGDLVDYHYLLSLNALHDLCRINHTHGTTLLNPCLLDDFYHQPEDHLYDISRRRGEYKRIMMRYAENAEKKQFIQVTFVKTGSSVEFYSIPCDLWSTSQGIIDHVNGNECRILSRLVANNAIIRPRYWDTWKNNSASAEYYDTRVYPLYKAAISTILHVRPTLKILDLGGGEGALDFSLCSEFPEIDHCVVLDQSQKAIQKIKSANCQRISAFEIDITDSQGVINRLSGMKFDVIILCGVVAEFVLTKEASEKVMKLMPQLLCEGGFVLISGYTSPHFNTGDYENFGFEVLNQVGTTHCCTPETIPFFVLQKRSEISHHFSELP